MDSGASFGLKQLKIRRQVQITKGRIECSKRERLGAFFLKFPSHSPFSGEKGERKAGTALRLVFFLVFLCFIFICLSRPSPLLAIFDVLHRLAVFLTAESLLDNGHRYPLFSSQDASVSRSTILRATHSMQANTTEFGLTFCHGHV
jgi:hypothetical protein